MTLELHNKMNGEVRATRTTATAPWTCVSTLIEEEEQDHLHWLSDSHIRHVATRVEGTQPTT